VKEVTKEKPSCSTGEFVPKLKIIEPRESLGARICALQLSEEDKASGS